jgi:flagella basal body P-ring formation protein FlgA
MSDTTFAISHNKMIKLAIMAILTLCLLTHSSADAFVKIHLNDRTEIENDKILLGEIGQIIGENRAHVEVVKHVVLGNAPLAGKTKYLTRDHVISRMKLIGIDLTTIQLVSSDKVEIVRSSMKINHNKIRKIIVDYLDKTLPWEKNDVNIKNIRVNNEPILPKGKITYKVVPPSNTDYVGLTPLSVHFYLNGKIHKKLMVSVNIEVMSDIVVTNKPLGRYQIITEDDISLNRMNLAKVSSNALRKIDDVLGKRTRRAIDSNTPLRPDLIELPPLIKRGDIVKIIVESDGLKVTALGKAKEKGRLGEIIKVTNVDSSKAIYARVLDANSVKVDY